MKELIFHGKNLSRSRCGLCTLFREAGYWCNASMRNPVFYNTPVMGCECFDDNGEKIRGYDYE